MKLNFQRFTKVDVYLPVEPLRFPVIEFAPQFDDRWTGYHDPATGVRLPYNKPVRRPAHDHPETKFDGRCGACIAARNRPRER